MAGRSEIGRLRRLVFALLTNPACFRVIEVSDTVQNKPSAVLRPRLRSHSSNKIQSRRPKQEVLQPGDLLFHQTNSGATGTVLCSPPMTTMPESVTCHPRARSASRS